MKDLSVLHVEDDAVIQFSVTSMFENMVKTVHRAQDGREGLEIFLREKPDVVITDIRIPQLSGLEMVDAIRRHDQDVPIIVTTAYNETMYLLKAIECGVDKYVVKPVDRRQLLEALSRCGETLYQRRRIEESGRFTRFLLDMQPNFILTLVDGRLEYANATFLDFLGCATLEELRTGGLAARIASLDGTTDQGAIDAWVAGLREQSDKGPVVAFRHKAGAFVSSVRHCPEGRHTLVSFTDITRLEAERQHWHDKAGTDHLTGAMNRTRFMDVLAEELQRAGRYRSPLNCLMFDIDDFKAINDRHGHHVGDQVLVAVCRLVAANIRKLDRLVRWGGEEFLLLAPGCSPREAELMAEKLRRIIAGEVFEGLGSRVTCSFGLTEYRPGDDADALLQRVDRAMYQAKTSGKNTVVVL